jgi:RNA polymerase sigma factor (sigma-70 family)
MSVAAVRRVVSRLEPTDPATDAELVAAIAPSGADREAAFAELVHRYGPMVLGVCRRVLADAHTAEDAFQAVFLVLARKAGAIRPPGAVAGWLHGVAVRTARKAKTAAARRRRREMAATALANPDREVGGDLQQAELRAIIDAELAALPETHRAAVVLCDLHGKTRAEAAAELDRPEGTVAAWLARGRKALAARLKRRGVTLSAAGLVAVAAPASVTAELASAALATFLGRAAPDAVLALAESVMRSLSTSVSKLAAVTVAVGALLAAVATATAWHNEPVPNPMANTQPAAAAEEPKPEPTTLGDHKGYVYSVSYSPDGKKFLSVGNGIAIVWDSDPRKKLFTIDAEFAAFSGDGKSLFALVKDEFRTHNADTGKHLGRKNRQAPKGGLPGRFAAFWRDATMWVEFDGVRHHLRTELTDDLYDLHDQFELGLTGGLHNVSYGRGGAFSPDGNLFAGLHRMLKDAKGGPEGSQGVLSIWNPTNGKRVGTISRGANRAAHAFAWSPDGKEIAVGYGDGMWVYDAKTLKEVRKFDVRDVTALAWSPDGKVIAVAQQVGQYKGGTGLTDDLIALTAVAALLDAQTGKELRSFDNFPDNVPVVSLALRPDGKQLVCGSGFFPGDGPAGNHPQPAKDAPALRVIPLADPPAKADPAAWKETKVLDLDGWLGGSVAYSADGKTLFVGGTSGGGHVRAYDASTWKQLWDAKTGKVHFAALAPAPDGKTLAVTTKDGIEFIESANGAAAGGLEEKGSEPLAVAWFPDRPPGPGGLATTRKVIFGSARESVVKTWLVGAKPSTIKSSTVAEGKKPADEYAVPLAVDPEGKRVVVTGPIDKDTGKNVLWAWSAGSGEANKLLEGHKAAVVCAAWSKDGKLIVTGDAGGVVITWDAATFKEKSRLKLGDPKLDCRVAAVAISPDGKYTAAAVTFLLEELKGREVYSEEVFVWSAANPPARPKAVSRNPAGGPFAGIASLAFTPDGKSLASCFANFTHLSRTGELIGKVRVFTLEPEKPKPEEKLGYVGDVRFSPDGKHYAVVTGGTVSVHDAATRKKVWGTPGEAVGYLPTGKTLFVMGAKAVLECDAETGKVQKEHPRPKTKVEWNRVAFAPDGKRFAAHFGHHVRLYDTATGTEPVQLKTQFEMAGWLSGVTGESVVFSPDGKKLAAVGVLVTEGGQRGAAVWDAETGNRLHTFAPAPADELRAAAFSPDSELLAVGFKNRVEVRYVGPGEVKKDPLMKLPTEAPVTALAYSKDEKRLAVALRKPAADGQGKPKGGHTLEVYIFDAETGEEMKRLGGFEGAGTTALGVTALAFSPDGKKLLAGTGALPIDLLPDSAPKTGEVKLFDLTAAPQPRKPDPSGDDAVNKLREQLKTGTPREKSAALATIRASKLTHLIPDLIEAIEDPATLPRDADTGWGFVGHQAASVLGELARSIDGIEVGMGPGTRGLPALFIPRGLR